MFSYIFLVLMLAPTVYMQKFVGYSCTLRNGQQNGLCTPASECTSAKEQYNRYKITPNRCGFEGNKIIICCDTGKFQNNPPPVRNTTPRVTNIQNNVRISERKCEEYTAPVTLETISIPLLLNSKPIKNRVANCIYSARKLIYGGVPVSPGEYPHMAAIGWELTEGRGYGWNCGGTLISEKFVLTAAHCLYLDGEEYANDGEPAVVRLGDIDLSTALNENSQQIKIKNSTPRTDYETREKYNDIALLELATPARLNSFVRPACLWTKSKIDEESAIATGWGYTNLSTPSDMLLKVNLNIMSRERCSQIFRITNKFSRGIIESQFCAGVAEGGKDTCGGDSGGPLQVQSESNPCIFHIIGLTSFGPRGLCGNANSGGVYTKISSYIDWIEKNVWPNE